MLRSLTWPLWRWRLLAHALILHTAVAVLLRAVPFGRLRRWGAAVYRPRASGPASPADEQTILWAVRRAAAMSRMNGTCLSEALAAHWLLQAIGRPSTIAFGVAASAHGPFSAHAWLQRDERIESPEAQAVVYQRLDRPASDASYRH